MKNFNFAIILPCTINPGNMPNVVRKDIKIRLKDYIKSFNFLINNKKIKKIILIENSGYDLNFFKKQAKFIQNKEIEIISTNSNNSFDKKLGKGYGEFLCLDEVFKKSYIAKNTNYFIKITGRYIIENFNQILEDIILNNSDIYINLSNNLKYAHGAIYGGSKNFFLNYVIPETEKSSDIINNYNENKLADATLKAVADGLTLSKIPVYPNIIGYIGTNGKEHKNNFFKRFKLFFFRKFKIYFFNHKKYKK